MKLHVSDTVLVIAGKDKGKKGKVMRLFPKAMRVTVEKVNVRTKHIKKKPGQPGQKIHFEGPISASNVMVVCPSCSKPTRVSHTMISIDGRERKQRICKKCKQSLDSSKTSRKKTTKKR